MSNPTSNFGWQMPTPTDLVTDLPADFEVFGQAVDTSMADLKGGTTGQMLTKATNTDMDFIWVTPQIGDITAITATSPLTGGGTSGDVTVGIQASSTTQSGAVQLEDSTSSTSTTKAATPNSVKSAYDLANAAIPKSTATAKGNVFTATAASTPTVLTVGTNGQVLTADSTAATGLKWATPASGTTAVGAQVLRTSTQGLTGGTTTAVSWSSAGTNTDSIWSSGSATRFTIPSGKGGVYQVSTSITFNNASGQVQFYLYKNGSVITNYSYVTSLNASNINGGSMNAILTLAAGDYIEIFVKSNNNAEVVGGLSGASIFYIGA